MKYADFDLTGKSGFFTRPRDQTGLDLAIYSILYWQDFSASLERRTFIQIRNSSTLFADQHILRTSYNSL